MTVDQLAAFTTTPGFYSGLVTGALISRTVRKTVGRFVRRRFGQDNG